MAKTSRRPARRAESASRKAAARRAKVNTTARRRPLRPAAPVRPRLRKRHEPETLRLRSVTPGFTVGDLHRSMAFYTDVLGFMVSERWTDGDKLLGVMLRAGQCEIGLSQDDWAKGRDRTKGVGCRIWCETAQDVDALAARVKAAGFTLTEEPKDQPWGDRSFSLDDPDGFHLTLFRSKAR